MPTDRWTATDILTRAALAAGKIDRAGPRGATLVTLDEIEAMATALVLLGLPAIPPGTPAPEIARRLNLKPTTPDGETE